MFTNLFKPRFVKHIEKGRTATFIQEFSIQQANDVVQIDHTLLYTYFEQRIFRLWIASMQVVLMQINEVHTSDKWKSVGRQTLLDQMKEIDPSSVDAVFDCFLHVQKQAKPGKGIDWLEGNIALGEWIIRDLEFNPSRHRPETPIKPDTAIRLGQLINITYLNFIHGLNLRSNRTT